ncbi:alpha/beta hydrolase [Duganella sp. FT27W]|uniref:alpha/beta hydrolase n=1 Tax=Duganella sp. FT27W TaxID=2654636 RepID=UPI00128CE565|nr:alpha/beta hydrolase [Duganella sp. FT27W]MPQ58359.1 alpha/beta hydrolase fold domain-containing protein [Duganella sp. FT27W]
MPRLSRTVVLTLVPLLLALSLAACSPLGTLNALTPASESERTESLAYGDHPRQILDVYRPLIAHGAAPVVVFFYGGNWVSGERADYAFIGRSLAAHGIVTVVADYRLYPQVRYPDFLKDAAQAVAWAKRHAAQYGGDPRRLFVMGHSAGAYNAAMVALDPRWLAAQDMTPADLRGWIGLAGPYDFLPVENTTTRPVFHFPDTPPDSQPVRHVSRQSPPALLIAARSDSLVNPQRNTGHLAQALRAQQVPVRELYYDRVSHTTLIASVAAPLRWLAPTLEDVAGYVLAGKGRAEPIAYRASYTGG